MMTLIQQLKKDQLQARKDRNTGKTSALTSLIAEASAVGFNDGKRDPTDKEVIQTIKKFIKNINEVIDALGDDTPKTYGDELKIYESYLPRQMTATELESAVNEIIRTIPQISIKSLGIVMKKLNLQYAGCFDGKQASAIVKAKLTA